MSTPSLRLLRLEESSNVIEHLKHYQPDYGILECAWMNYYKNIVCSKMDSIPINAMTDARPISSFCLSSFA
jgi:hypothetical protein